MDAKKKSLAEITALDGRLKESVNKLNGILEGFKLNVNADTSVCTIFDQIQSLKGSIGGIDLFTTEEGSDAVMVATTLTGSCGARGNRPRNRATIKLTYGSVPLGPNGRPRLPMPIQIPDKVLETIFSNFSVAELIRLRLVSTRWRKVIQKVISEKKTLKLVIIAANATAKEMQEIMAEPQHRHYLQGISGYIRTDVSCSIAKEMKRQFSGVLKLDVLFLYAIPLTPMLRNWSKTLTCLTLRKLASPAMQLEKLWSVISTMKHLKELHLSHLTLVTLPESMPILAQLEAFTLVGYKGDITTVLSGLGGNCKRLMLDFVLCTSYQIFKLMERNDNKLCPGVTHLTLGELSVPPTDERWLASNYQEVLTLFGIGMISLVSLELRCASQFKMDVLSQRLSTYFASISSLHLVYRRKYVDNFSLPAKAILCPIKTVTRLYFQFGYLSFDHFEKTVSVVFPNATVVDIDCEDNDFKVLLKKKCGNKLICLQ